MKRWPVVGLALAVLWLFINGTPLTLESPVESAENILASFLGGLVIGMPIAYVFRRFYNEEIDIRGGVAAIPFAALYLLLFMWELLTANLDVARRVLSPSMPIEPDVVEVPLRVQSDLAITTIANSITLTPGTLTMDYNDERNSLYVHGITGKNRDAVVEPIRRWEDYALIVFDERLKPRDPVPDPDAMAEASDADTLNDASEMDENGGATDGE